MFILALTTVPQIQKMWDVFGALRRLFFFFFPKWEEISCQRQTGSAFDGANLHSVVEGGGGSGVGC